MEGECQRRSDVKENAVEEEWGEKKGSALRSTEWMSPGRGGRGEGERAREGRHVTKCILITEQQMSRTELLCCLNSRTLHFSGLTSHRIHLPASCQFRVERVRKKEKEMGERERREGGSPQSVPPLPRHVLQRGCHSLLSSPGGLYN